MTISKLNVAVLVQLAGLILLCVSWGGLPARIAGALVIVVGGVMYRREQKRLKASAASASSSTAGEA